MAKKNLVILTEKEFLHGAIVGVDRAVHAKTSGLKNRYKCKQDDFWRLNIEGALAEAAVAKFLNLYWTGSGVGFESDIGGYEVRSTPLENGCLILHPADNDQAIFWLVTGKQGRYDIKGWIRGRQGKLNQFWSDPSKTGRHAFFVPQRYLNSPFTIRQNYQPTEGRNNGN